AVVHRLEPKGSVGDAELEPAGVEKGRQTERAPRAHEGPADAVAAGDLLFFAVPLLGVLFGAWTKDRVDGRVVVYLTLGEGGSGDDVRDGGVGNACFHGRPFVKTSRNDLVSS